jgi:hypothetical protein
MLGWVKRHKVLTAAALLLIAPAVLNYSGMCIPEGRWLSDEERIDIAIKQIIAPKEVFLMRGVAGPREYEVVPYGSVKDFRQKNPDCCTVKFAYKPQDVLLIDHLRGKVSFWTPVVWKKINYKYEGEVHEYNDVSGFEGFGDPFFLMSNCGIPFRK